MVFTYFEKRIWSYAICIILLASCQPVNSGKSTELNQKPTSIETFLLNSAQNNCASWQAIELTGDEKILLNELTERDNYSYNSLDKADRQSALLYIKTLDYDFLKDKQVPHDSNDKVRVISYHLSQNRYEDKLIGYDPEEFYKQYFDASIYRDIKQNIENIKINSLDELMNDPHAQFILKLDTQGMHELYNMIGDTTLTQSYDDTTGRQLSIGDLANGLLMIIHGQDYWEDINYPAPIDGIYDLKFEQLISAPEWDTLSQAEKNKAFQDEEYLKFISRSWELSISLMSYINQGDVSLKIYGWQTPEWIKSILSVYPNDSKSHTFENYNAAPIVHQPDTLKSLKFKLVTALHNAEQVLNECS